MAGDFLFTPDDLKKPMGVLSGGEKSRLTIAGLLLAKPDVLILDEPTNHLDFETVEALGGALAQFNGTIIFTSHDRTFANMVATEIIELSKGKIKRDYHDYEDYVSRLEKRLANHQEANSSVSLNPKKKINIDYEKVKETKKRLKSLENKLTKLEAERKLLYQYFLENTTNYDHRKKTELTLIEKEIKKTETEWFSLID